MGRINCSMCGKAVDKSNFIAFIERNIWFSLFLWGNEAYTTYTLGYWLVKGNMEKMLDKKLTFMHYSCAKKRKYVDKVSSNSLASSIDYWIKLMALTFFAVVFIIGVATPLLFKIKGPFPAYYFTIIWTIGLIILLVKLFPLYKANRYVYKRINQT